MFASLRAVLAAGGDRAPSAIQAAEEEEEEEVQGRFWEKMEV